MEGGTGEPSEKPLEQGDNQQQTQPTYDAGSGNRIQNTLAGGERSQGILLPELINQIFKKDYVILPVIKT